MKLYRFRTSDLQKLFNESLWKEVQMDEYSIDGHFVVDVHLTEAMLITALVIGARTKQHADNLRVDEGMAGGYKEYVVGDYGTLAAAAYIYKNWLQGLDYVVFGKADEGDLKIGKQIADVKTGSRPNYKLFVVNKRQWNRKEYDFYIGCNVIELNKIVVMRIWGYITREKFKAEGTWNDFGYGPKYMALTIPYVELSDIRELLGKSSTD